MRTERLCCCIYKCLNVDDIAFGIEQTIKGVQCTLQQFSFDVIHVVPG